MFEEVGGDIFGCIEVLLRNHGEGTFIWTAVDVDAITRIAYLGEVISLLGEREGWEEEARYIESNV